MENHTQPLAERFDNYRLRNRRRSDGHAVSCGKERLDYRIRHPHGGTYLSVPGMKLYEDPLLAELYPNIL